MGNSWLDGEICPVCNKKFFIRQRKKEYIYKLVVGGKKVQYMCSWTCKHKMEEMIENEKNDNKGIQCVGVC